MSELTVIDSQNISEELKQISEDILSATVVLANTPTPDERLKAFRNTKCLNSESTKDALSIFSNGDDLEPNAYNKLSMVITTIVAAKVQFLRGLKTITVENTEVIGSNHTSVMMDFIGITHDVKIIIIVNENSRAISSSVLLDQYIVSPLLNQTISEDFFKDAELLSKDNSLLVQDNKQEKAKAVLDKHAALLDFVGCQYLK